MATRIQDIFNALAAMPVIFDAENNGTFSVVNTFNVDEVPETFYSTDTPCRFLVPLGTRTEARSITPVTISGSVATIGWRVIDEFFLKPVGQTEGLATEMPTLLRYMIAYFNAMQQLGFQLSRYGVVENMTFQPMVEDYPAEGDTQYFAVQVVLGVKEIAQ